MPPKIAKKAATPPTAMPDTVLGLRALDWSGLEGEELVGVLDEPDELEELLVDAGKQSASP